jgi:hypothetical protein
VEYLAFASLFYLIYKASLDNLQINQLFFGKKKINLLIRKQQRHNIL